MKPINVLVTGVGAIIGYGIIRSLRLSKIKTKVIGMDTDPKAIGFKFSDNYLVGPRADATNYITSIIEIYKKYKIDLVIPGIPQDVIALSQNRYLLPKSLKVVLNTREALRLEQDKWETYKFLHRKDLPTPPTLLGEFLSSKDLSKLKYPQLLKLRNSFAGKGMYLVNNPKEAKFYLEKNPSYIIQEVVGKDSEEYTCGLFGFPDGSTTDIIIMKRVLSYGSTFKAEVGKFPLVRKVVIQLTKSLKILGPTNIQIRVQNKIPYIIEINARVSSSSSLRTLFGFNEPELCIRSFFLKEQNIVVKIKSGYANRYIEDFLWK